MTNRSLDLLRDVLDHEIVDVDGVSCGMVDDVELGDSADGPRAEALLVGPGAWSARLPALLRWLAEKTTGRSVVRVPWEQIAQVSETIKLKSKASALQLGRVDRKVGAWLSRMPRS
jgi:sporulation protein YlmC with PRC-barrel domain